MHYPCNCLKEVIKLRKQDKNEREKRESLLDLYMRDGHGIAGAGEGGVMQAG
ncbi:GapR family DNA-binding domain-containing protein [Bradyrhizobium sp. UNPA324]|uniref:GapR family DNA-binding domain-containing protein n=1 Tax=Bradyrhizobium sp. UNPA324 TaxID=1141174 RepID=UPI001150B209|nr:GapR family DNA-binding domain-containing protein [Bradyrhizobium sp. UNPA324]